MEKIKSVIYGRTLHLSGDESSEVLKKVASTLDKTMHDIKNEGGPQDFDSVLLRAALHLSWLYLEEQKSTKALRKVLDEAMYEKGRI